MTSVLFLAHAMALDPNFDDDIWSGSGVPLDIVFGIGNATGQHIMNIPGYLVEYIRRSEIILDPHQSLARRVKCPFIVRETKEAPGEAKSHRGDSLVQLLNSFCSSCQLLPKLKSSLSHDHLGICSSFFPQRTAVRSLISD